MTSSATLTKQNEKLNFRRATQRHELRRPKLNYTPYFKLTLTPGGARRSEECSSVVTSVTGNTVTRDFAVDSLRRTSVTGNTVTRDFAVDSLERTSVTGNTVTRDCR